MIFLVKSHQMPAKSKAQQKFMGMVHGLQKGTVKPSSVSGKVKKSLSLMIDVIIVK